MVYVHSLILLTTILTSTEATNTTMRYVYFEKERIINIFNQTIVESTFNRRSFLACANTCSQISGAVSLYWNEEAAACYCNNELDENALASSATDSIIYAKVTRVYEIRRISEDETAYAINDGIEYDNCEDIAGVTNTLPTSLNEIYCTMNSDVWTVFQKRFDGSEDFYRNWTDYVNGFGSPGGEFWLGLEAIHQATYTGTCELMILLEAESTHPVKASGYARYSSFWIGGADTNYSLHVAGFSGTDGVGDSFSYHDNQMFTTYDADNDKYGVNCAHVYKGGWWYNACHYVNLNGLYLAGNHSSFADGMEWYSPWTLYYSLLRTQMVYKCA